MRPYKRLTIICGMISFFSLAICLCLHYFAICDESDFWINVCLAVFGSALLSSLTSLVTYFHEKRSTLEGFMYHCKYIFLFSDLIKRLIIMFGISDGILMVVEKMNL